MPLQHPYRTHPLPLHTCAPPTSTHTCSCNIPIKGKRAVVVGRSNIVGMPAAMLLNKKDATVTICHSATKVR